RSTRPWEQKYQRPGRSLRQPDSLQHSLPAGRRASLYAIHTGDVRPVTGRRPMPFCQVRGRLKPGSTESAWM
ncbi:MAG: hypothetical protein ACFNLC_03720, partial [Prevotella denticola]